MKFTVFAAIAAFSVFAPAATTYACTADGKEGIGPENHLWIPDSRFGSFALSEKKFDAAIAKVEKVYAPVFSAQGRTFRVIAKWKDGTVNAYAKRNGNVSEVYMFGGLARHGKMTNDGFMLVVCHETGHHLGASPKVNGIFGRPTWASNEGQADYFSTLKCAREVWKDEDNIAIVAQMIEKQEVPNLVTEKCQKAFDAATDIAICQRSAVAGMALGNTLADMGRDDLPDFEHPDPRVVKRMDNSHPKAQCRLDTYFAGAVCSKSKDESLSETDPTAGTCAQERGEVLGIRPTCWYLPVDRDSSQPRTTWPSAL